MKDITLFNTKMAREKKYWTKQSRLGLEVNFQFASFSRLVQPGSPWRVTRVRLRLAVWIQALLKLIGCVIQFLPKHKN